MLIDLSQYLARIAGSNNIGRQIFRYYASCAHDYVITDCNTGEYDCACTYPAVFPNMDRRIILICFLPQFR